MRRMRQLYFVVQIFLILNQITTIQSSDSDNKQTHITKNQTASKIASNNKYIMQRNVTKAINTFSSDNCYDFDWRSLADRDFTTVPLALLSRIKGGQFLHISCNNTICDGLFIRIMTLYVTVAKL